MKDLLLLRHRLAIALACFPLTFSAPLLGSCDDTYIARETPRALDATQQDTQSTIHETPDGSIETSPDAVFPDVPPHTPDTSPDVFPDVPPDTSPDTFPDVPPDPDMIGGPFEELFDEGDGFCFGSWSMFSETAWRLAEESQMNWGNPNPIDVEMNCPVYFYADPPEGFTIDTFSPEGLNLYLNYTETETLQSQHGNDVCQYYWDNFCGGGRALLDGATPTNAETMSGDAWSEELQEKASLLNEIQSLPKDIREKLAAEWLQDAKIEHASIASFGRAMLELMSLGAPPELLSGCAQGAADEVEHARLCFSLHALYSEGKNQAPSPMHIPNPRFGTLADLAINTLLEGCIGETIAVLIVTRALSSCTFPPIRSVLEVILEDETRHAALAWATLGWTIKEGGEPVLIALREAVKGLAPTSDDVSSQLSPQEITLMAKHGRLDRHGHQQARRDTWRGVILPYLQSMNIG